jgi:hypothetical protein
MLLSVFYWTFWILLSGGGGGTVKTKGLTLTYWGPKLCQVWDAPNIRKSKYIFIILTEGNIKKQTWKWCELKHYTSIDMKGDFVKQRWTVFAQ